MAIDRDLAFHVDDIDDVGGGGDRKEVDTISVQHGAAESVRTVRDSPSFAEGTDPLTSGRYRADESGHAWSSTV